MKSSPTYIASYEDAVAFLDARIGAGIKPGLERIFGLLEYLGDPQTTIPVIHVAGTNGKSTTVGMVGALLSGLDLRVGTFVSPHLHHVEERYAINSTPIDRDQFVQAVADVAPFCDIYEDASGEKVSYFELTTAIAFQLFAAEGLDVAVVEVGLGGRWDATNVVDAAVSVVTGISLDHQAVLGSTIAEIAAEKVAILKDGGTLVTGPMPAAADGAATAQVSQTSAQWYRFGDDFDVEGLERVPTGWLVDVRGLHEVYTDLRLNLHGRHQTAHLATAVAVTEVFLDRELPGDLIIAAVESIRAPGRSEVVFHEPLVLIDGAHNEEGLDGLATTMSQEFPAISAWTLVIGVRGDRDPEPMIRALGEGIVRVIACAPDDPQALGTDVVSAAAARVVGDDNVSVADTVADALKAAIEGAEKHEGIVVAGSLYVAGEARTALGLAPP
ncbi:MAG TPA: dihydrofolate synthase [Actinobacteria bacterium]|nr:folylpolyglutamate synthase [bacterium BMS3Bbin02]HDL41389.1 dihydrofolate synthase [Actinomycetota bacterium]